MDTLSVPFLECTVQWAAEALDELGYPVSLRRVRLYADLLSPPVKTLRCKTQDERRFSQGDLVRLTQAVVLKELGFSSRESRAWFKGNGSARALINTLVARIEVLSRVLKAAKQLVPT